MPSPNPIIPVLLPEESAVVADIRQSAPHNQLTLGFRGVASLWPAGGAPTVRVIRGVAWTTQEGDRHDYILRAGEAVGLARHGRVAIQAVHRDGVVITVDDLAKA